MQWSCVSHDSGVDPSASHFCNLGLGICALRLLDIEQSQRRKFHYLILLIHSILNEIKYYVECLLVCSNLALLFCVTFTPSSLSLNATTVTHILQFECIVTGWVILSFSGKHVLPLNKAMQTPISHRQRLRCNRCPRRLPKSSIFLLEHWKLGAPFGLPRYLFLQLLTEYTFCRE